MDQTNTKRRTNGTLSGEGEVYTKGRSFRALAEARQRWFRVQQLDAGWQKYGHLLDDRAIEQGLNFVHPTSRNAAELRAAAGKGVHRERTFGNMLSSQALCFNLFAPMAANPEGLKIASTLLANFIPDIARVRSIEIEHTPANKIFQDQSGPAGVDCDLLVEFECRNGERGVLVVETKFVEASFSCCGHRRKSSGDPCPDDVQVGSDFSGCRYVYKNHFQYWRRSAETRSIRLPLLQSRGCPFGGPLWQLWVNHALAHAIAAERKASRAVFAVCAPSENEELLARGAILQEFRQHLSDPASVVFLPLEALLDRLAAMTKGNGDWHSWAERLRQRYLVQGEKFATPPAMPSTTSLKTTGVLTSGHRKTVAWMATQAFRDLVAVHRAACGQRATIYFRPTHRGLVRVALHPGAPGYVGFRCSNTDESHLLSLGSSALSVASIQNQLRGFEAWLPTVRRNSKEEQGVIPLLRAALDGDLSLVPLGRGWILLNQEWRWRTAEGKDRKSDILAVHLPTGKLGILEFKSSPVELPAARIQVQEYGRF